MPLYQYRGIECEHEFEVRQSFADDPITVCEVCGKPVRRVIHASPVVFKGSGWYITDSRPTSDPVGGVKDVSKKSDATDSRPAADAKSTESADVKTPAATAAKTE